MLVLIVILLILLVLLSSRERATTLPSPKEHIEDDLCKLPLLKVTRNDTSTLWNRTLKYEEVVWDISQELGVDYYLVFAIIWTESSGRENVKRKEDSFYSYGLMQITLNAARDVGFRGGWRELMEPRTNIYYGTRYLSKLLSEWRNPVLAVAAYNAGTRRVKEWLGKGLKVEEFPNYRYIRRVASYYCILAKGE